jgi:uncharacterized membrane protein YdjX (TVP38/TMEM64 family)
VRSWLNAAVLRRLGAAALALVALVVAGRWLGGYIPRFVATIDRLGPLGPLAFVAAYILATVALIPASLLTLAAGVTFGLVRGTLYTLLGAVLGATAAFLIARYAARGAVERRIAANPRFAAIDGAVGDRGLTIVTLLRLSPVVPFSLLNYALGLTRVRLADYLIAMVGIIPGTLLYVYIGKVAGDLAARQTASAAHTAVLILGLAATLAATVLITRTARRALAARGAAG